MNYKRRAKESVTSGNVAFEGDDEDVQNIVIFGTTGSGKSSLINLLLSREAAPTSNDAIGCTATNESYLFSGDATKYKLWDTPGLNEGSEGLVPAREALENLTSLVKELKRDRNRAPLSILCIQGSQAVKAQLRHYDNLKSTIGAAPFAIVVTGMDVCPSRPWSTWWNEHQKVLQSFSAANVDHACVCTLLDDDESAGSREEIINLIKRTTLRSSSKSMRMDLQGDDEENHGRTLHRDTDPLIPNEAWLEHQPFFDWKGLFARNQPWTTRRKVTCVCIVTIIVLVCLFAFFHTQIVRALQPAVERIHDLKFGWLIPIAIFFVISFPPLFGHEILAVLCGLVWGTWIGFGITAAGTFVGEVANFYTFKHICQARGDKLQNNNIMYAALCRVVRERGFKVVLVARYSAIPGHLTTAIFSVCGMNILVFMLAAVLSLPKQFITVYIGVMLESDPNSSATSTSNIIGDVVVAITLLVTIAAMWYINKAVNEVKQQLIKERQESRYLDVSVNSPGTIGADDASSQDDSSFDETSDDSRDDTSCGAVDNESHPEGVRGHAGSMPLPRPTTRTCMPDTAEGQSYGLNTLPYDPFPGPHDATIGSGMTSYVMGASSRTGGPSAAR
ncbi:uncharacterized protein EDB91DRAFT_169072 [Suillus paluster]|uniref:uncharacterized protein n=1 Tax=Suillus paluster TaxID=48578 RepID=UPI001B862E89|nr:uncharacterized protein EDB91DRAFT_169072 [Suillus paluster]KAG1744957.1 hypothetical protein EDB91DRAFT_169072 [Suillus paluster]